MKLTRTLFLAAGLMMMLAACASAQDGGTGDEAEIRQFLSTWNIDIEKRVIDLAELKPGGPPKDGIPSIDTPQFVSTAEARTWLGGQEPVIRFEHEGDVRAYPLQVLVWHEVVNDVVGGVRWPSPSARSATARWL